MRNISFAMTTPQFLDGSKDVTRRFGWKFLKAGDHLQAVAKSQGLKKGEKIKVLGVIEVVSVREEPVDAMITDKDYGFEELRREGYPMGIGWPSIFVQFLCDNFKKKPADMVTRIEFKRIHI